MVNSYSYFTSSFLIPPPRRILCSVFDVQCSYSVFPSYFPSYFFTSLFSVLCSVFDVRIRSSFLTSFLVQCSVFDVRCSYSVFPSYLLSYFLPCSVFSVQCSMFSVRCSVFDVQITLRSKIENRQSDIIHHTASPPQPSPAQDRHLESYVPSVRQRRGNRQNNRHTKRIQRRNRALSHPSF